VVRRVSALSVIFCTLSCASRAGSAASSNRPRAEQYAGSREPMPRPMLKLRRAVERAMTIALSPISLAIDADSRVRSDSPSSSGCAIVGIGRDAR